MFARAALILAVLLATASLAAAQVATSDLTAGTARFAHPEAIGLNGTTYTPDNPAALQWGGPSRAGGGVIDGETEDSAASETNDITGKFAGFRAVGDAWSVAVGYQNAEMENPGPGTPALDSTDIGAQIAFKLGESLTVGGGLARHELDGPSEFFPVLDATREVNRQSAGATVRFGALYLGAFLGVDKLDVSVPGAPSVSAERDVTGYGLGLRTERNTWQWYLEYNQIKHDPFFANPDGGSFKTSDLTGQVMVGNVMLGYGQRDIDFEDDATALAIDEVKVTTLDVGWVPTEGLSFAARRSETKQTYTDSSDVTATVTALALNMFF